MISLKQASKNLFSNHRYYIKILLSLIILVALSTLLISIIFTSIFIKDIGDQLATDNINNINRVCSEFDNIFYQLRQLNSNLRQSPDATDFLNSASTDFYVVNRADIYANKTKNLSQYLNSIILYNKNTELVINTSRSGVDIQQFIRNETYKFSLLGKIKLVQSKVKQANSSDSPVQNMPSVLFTEYTVDGVLSTAIIMVTDREEIEKKLFSNMKDSVIVCDNNGKVAFSSNNHSKADSIANEAYFGRIKAAGKPFGNFQATNDNMVITYTKSSETDLYIINLRSMDSFTNIIRKKELTLIVISAAILLVLILISLMLSRNIYTPVRKITEKLTNSFSSSKVSSSSTGEFAFISDVFEGTLKELSSLQFKSEDINNRLKEDFSRRLLKNGMRSDMTRNATANFKFNIQLKNIILVCIRIDNYHKLDSMEKFTFESTFCRFAPELLANDFLCEAVNMYEGEIAFLLNYKNTTENSFNDLVNAMDNIRTITQRTLQTTITVGIGGFSESLADCNSAYQKAREVAKHRFVLGLNKTIYQKFLDENLSSKASIPEELENRLISSIKHNDRSLYMESLRNIIAQLEKCNYSDAVSSLFQIITDCIKTISQITSQDNNNLYLSFDEFSRIFSNLETLDQAYDWLVEIFEKYQQILEGINQLKNNKHHKIVENMQTYINNNFHDVNICVESVAEAANYTSYYFSKIFKDITGLNVNDYIRQLRINKAKELLSRSDIKINDIAEAVGIPNASHFYTIFKKDVGLTPSAYRAFVTSNSK